LVTIAAKAVERADARVLELLTERELLADKMAEAIRQVGEALVADETAPNVPVEFASPFPNAIFNGIDEAYAKATQP
jgi:hypothetical protein